MSKLQRRAVKAVMGMYLLVLALGAFFVYQIVYLPLRERAVEQYLKQNGYLMEDMDSTLKAVMEYTNYIACSGELKEELKAYEETKEQVHGYEIASILNMLKDTKTGVRSIAIQTEKASKVYSLIPPSKEEQSLFQTKWYEKLRRGKYGGSFSEGLVFDTENGNEMRSFAYGKHYRTHGVEFTVTVFWDYQEIFGKIQRSRRREFDRELWMTPEGTPFFKEQEAEEKLAAIAERKQEIQREEEGVYFVQSLYQYPFTSVTFVSNQVLNETFKEYLATILLLLSAFFVISLLVVFWIIGSISKPVYKLSKAMSNAVEQNLDVNLPVWSKDEIGDLGRIFNQMIADLKGYVQKLIEKEKQEENMRFGLLASQIDPHFICNTLNTVNYLARQKRYEDVAVVSTALSNILRDRLRLKDFQNFDTVDQEILTVKHYLKIQEYRYGNMVTLHWKVQEDVLEEKIPKNLLQPLIENALLHGLADEETGEIAGNIWISIGRNERAFYIEVEDDGQGMSPQRLQQVQNEKENVNVKGHGIGISGIRERLGLLYGKGFKLNIESIQGQGSKIEIVLYSWVRIEKEKEYEGNKNAGGVSGKSSGD